MYYFDSDFEEEGVSASCSTSLNYDYSMLDMQQAGLVWSTHYPDSVMRVIARGEIHRAGRNYPTRPSVSGLEGSQ